MGHRDIWGKNPAKWKKQCPCFDAEKEYAHLDDIKIEKYDDSSSEPAKVVMPLFAQEQPKNENIWDKIKNLVPWHKK